MEFMECIKRYAVYINGATYKDCIFLLSLSLPLPLPPSLSPSLSGPPRLLVNRPTANSLSFVRLSCVDASMTDIRGAIFFRNGAELTTSSSQVTIVGNSRNGEVLFTFTQEQEGLFHCESSGLASIAVGLAGEALYMYGGCN